MTQARSRKGPQLRYRLRMTCCRGAGYRQCFRKVHGDWRSEKQIYAKKHIVNVVEIMLIAYNVRNT